MSALYRRLVARIISCSLTYTGDAAASTDAKEGRLGTTVASPGGGCSRKRQADWRYFDRSVHPYVVFVRQWQQVSVTVWLVMGQVITQS